MRRIRTGNRRMDPADRVMMVKKTAAGIEWLVSQRYDESRRDANLATTVIGFRHDIF
jgi:hypothetical protein